MWKRLLSWQTASVLLALLAGIVLPATLYRPAAALSGIPSDPGGRLHIVARGDDFASIAAQGVFPAQALRELNGLAPDHELWVGQPLQLPAPEPTGDSLTSVNQYHRVLLGETLHRIANQYGLHPVELAHLNRMSPNEVLYTGQQIRVPSAGMWARLQESGYMAQFETYRLQETDTLDSVALLYQVSAESLRMFNALEPAAFPQPGTQLTIPARPVAPPFGLDPVSPSGLGQIVRVKERWLEVDLGARRLIAYEGMTPVRRLTILNGGAEATTATGLFRIWAKTARQDMSRHLTSNLDLAHLDSVPWVQYFYQDFAIHGAFWDVAPDASSDNGNVLLSEEEAAWLYEWTTPTSSGGVKADDGWVLGHGPGSGTLVFVHA